MGGGLPTPEKNMDLPNFTPECVHLLLQGVYGDFPHHSDESQLDRGVADEAIWQRHWHLLDTQSASWYSTAKVEVGRRFMAILFEEWKEVLDHSWDFNRPLFFTHVVLTKTLSVLRAREIRVQITRRMDLWERGLHAGLVGDDEAEGDTREGRERGG